MNTRLVDTKLEDSDLDNAVSRLQAGVGTSADQELIYRRFYKPLVTFFLKNGSHDASEDLAQVTMLRVFEGIPYFRREAPFAVWVRRIAQRIWLNEVRKSHRNKRSATNVSIDKISEEELPISDPSANPLRDVLMEERIRLLRQAIPEMPKQMRRIFTLYLSGTPIPNISSLLKISVGSVKTQLHRARQILRQKFVEEGLVDDGGF